jgi:ParB/RepB/Spo0J family partition protein
MVYKEIELQYVLPNPFQTRKIIDEDEIDRLAATIDESIGIRNAPLVRPSSVKPGYYEVASGWRRLLAARKKGLTKLQLRIENLTDSMMKQEVLVENISRVNLEDDEMFQALEQVRQDIGLDVNEKTLPSTLAKISGLSSWQIEGVYTRQRLLGYFKDEETKPSTAMIIETSGLEDKERVALIKKAESEGWSQRTVRATKVKLRTIESEARKEILKPETKLAPAVIQKVADLPKEMQKDVVIEARIRRLNEPEAIKMVDRIIEGTQPQVDRTINEPKEILDEITDTLRRVKTWGVNQYGILGPVRWGQASEFFSQIEEHMRWLKRKGWEGN